MTLPLQTFRVSATYPFIPAGASATVLEVLQAINDMLVAEVANGSYWGVSDYNAGAGTLEIKRRGSPSGVLATFRELLFGGVGAPNAAAIGSGVTATANILLFAGCSQDANTTGPTSSWNSAAPYATRWSKATVVATASAFIKTATPHVFMVESDEMCAIFINDNNGTSSVIFGAIAERLIDNSRVWASAASGSVVINVAGINNLTAAASWFIGGQTAVSIAGNASVGYHNGVEAQALNRNMAVGDAADSLYAAPNGILIPITVSKRRQADAVPEAFGVMRQLRFGPQCINKIAVYDSTPTLQAYGVSSGYNLARCAMYFDTVA